MNLVSSSILIEVLGGLTLFLILVAQSHSDQAVLGLAMSPRPALGQLQINHLMISIWPSECWDRS